MGIFSDGDLIEELRAEIRLLSGLCERQNDELATMRQELADANDAMDRMRKQFLCIAIDAWNGQSMARKESKIEFPYDKALAE